MHRCPCNIGTPALSALHMGRMVCGQYRSGLRGELLFQCCCSSTAVPGLPEVGGSRKALKEDSPRGGTLIYAGKRRCVSTPATWMHAHATLRAVLDLVGGRPMEPQPARLTKRLHTLRRQKNG